MQLQKKNLNYFNPEKRMKTKKILIFLFLISSYILSGCTSRQNSDKQNSDTTSEVPKYIMSVNGDGVRDTADCSCRHKIGYQIYTFQGCEYIMFVNGKYSSFSLSAHSGTCPNPIHQYKPDAQYNQPIAKDTTQSN